MSIGPSRSQAACAKHFRVLEYSLSYSTKYSTRLQSYSLAAALRTDAVPTPFGVRPESQMPVTSIVNAVQYPFKQVASALVVRSRIAAALENKVVWASRSGMPTYFHLVPVAVCTREPVEV